MKRIFLLSFLSVSLFACTKSNMQQPEVNDEFSDKTSAKNADVMAGRMLSTHLKGENEVPVMGDPDGMGTAMFTLNYGQGTISYKLSVENIDPATAAHIHIAPAGEAGAVVVALMAPTDGYSSGTIEVDREIIKAIIQNPEWYYVNVHNPMYPGGAVRGQLSK